MKVELVTTLKRQATKILSDLHTSKEPVLITEHGQPSAYLVDVDDFKSMMYRDFKDHSSAGPSRAQPTKRPLSAPGSGDFPCLFHLTPPLSRWRQLSGRVPHAGDKMLGAKLLQTPCNRPSGLKSICWFLERGLNWRGKAGDRYRWWRPGDQG